MRQSNIIIGNYIGTDVSGTLAIGNTEGVSFNCGSSHNRVGGSTPGEGNLISGNSNNGVAIGDPDTMGNAVIGNFIGTDVSGAIPLANVAMGVRLGIGADGNTVGGTTTGDRNVISGNGRDGVHIWAGRTNRVVGNYIGVKATGDAALGNHDNGVWIGAGAQQNTIGGITAAERNIISGNGNGVWMHNPGTDQNVIIGNYIGTDASGTAPIPNTSNGVGMMDGPQSNRVGGSTAGERNIISGNGQDGVLLSILAPIGNTVSGNYIGTNAAGTAALPNGMHGVQIVGGAAQNIIGGSTPGERNVISGNQRYGIRISDLGTDGNIVTGNFIGVDSTGTAALGNNSQGIVIAFAAKHNRIGGVTSGERNVVSGNGCFGIGLGDPGTAENVVLGNYVGLNASGMAALGNGCEGVVIAEGPQGNIIGGDSPAARNVISGNARDGLTVSGSGTMNNIVSGNYIGISASGTITVPNRGNGVTINSGASSNTIGGVAAGERNMISGNGNGVWIDGTGTSNNVMIGNYIGLNPSGTAALAMSTMAWALLPAHSTTGSADRLRVSGISSAAVERRIHRRHRY